MSQTLTRWAKVSTQGVKKTENDSKPEEKNIFFIYLFLTPDHGPFFSFMEPRIGQYLTSHIFYCNRRWKYELLNELEAANAEVVLVSLPYSIGGQLGHLFGPSNTRDQIHLHRNL